MNRSCTAQCKLAYSRSIHIVILIHIHTKTDLYLTLYIWNSTTSAYPSWYYNKGSQFSPYGSNPIVCNSVSYELLPPSATIKPELYNY
jgi:hypothetical protein